MFRFTHDDKSIEDGFRRIAIDQLDKMLADYQNAAHDPASAIHDLRKRCKRMRGLLRLVGPRFSGYRAENAAIRDAAAGLAGTRDAQALVETFDHYIATGQAEAGRFAQARQALAEDCQGLSGAGDTVVAAFADAMRAMRQRAETWSLDARGFPALRRGLARTYTAGREGMAHAHKKSDPAIFHDWRKAVKYHGHHLLLLREFAPDLLPTHHDLADRLGEILGDHHNLAVLRQTLGKAPDRYGTPPDIVALHEIAAGHASALEQQAFAIGSQLLAEKPDALIERFRFYWKSWR